MAALLPLTHRTPPRLYRLARLLRRLSVLLLVLILVFLGTVGYSAVRLVQSSPQSGGYTAGFAANGTVAVSGTVSLSNPGFYPLNGFEINLRILNSSGAFIGEASSGTVTIPAGGAASFPVSLSLPVTTGGPAASLLVTDQSLSVGIWGNATYAYLFPVSVHFAQNKSWGAPFALLHITPGTPTTVNGSAAVPVTLSFSNDASFTEFGRLVLGLYQSSGVECSATSFSLNVATGTLYDQTQDVPLDAGCSLAGGYALATFTGSGATIALPREALP